MKSLVKNISFVISLCLLLTTTVWAANAQKCTYNSNCSTAIHQNQKSPCKGCCEKKSNQLSKDKSKRNCTCCSTCICEDKNTCCADRKNEKEVSYLVETYNYFSSYFKSLITFDETDEKESQTSSTNSDETYYLPLLQTGLNFLLDKLSR